MERETHGQEGNEENVKEIFRVGSVEILSTNGSLGFGKEAISFSEIKGKVYDFKTLKKVLYIPKVRTLIKFSKFRLKDCGTIGLLKESHL